MFKVLREWLNRKWVDIDPDLARDYQVTFSIPEGQRVLRHLLDTIYYQVVSGNDSNASLIMNARRSVVHEILINIDVGEHPDKYKTKTTDQTIEEILDGSGSGDSR